MTPSITLSSLSRRSAAPAISELMQAALSSRRLISLAAGFVDHATLPVEATAKAAAAMLGEPMEGRRALQYGTTHGDPRLRTHLMALLEREEGLAEGSLEEVLSRVVVTTGSQQLLYLISETLLDPGDIVLVEAPTYFVFLDILRSRGARAIGVAIDDGGLRLDALESVLARIEAEGQLDRVKLIYTITEHSNPTGLSLAADRRRPLVELARRWSKAHRLLILEDAAYRGLTFAEREPPSVWRHDLESDEGRTVILARTFSKTLSPGLRVGFGVLPEDLVGPVLAIKGNHDFGSANFNQQLLEHLIDDGSYARQIEILKAIYRSKRDAVLAALAEHLGPLVDQGVSWTCPAGGMYVWLSLPERLDTRRSGPLFQRSIEEGVLYVPGAYAYPAEPGPVPSNHIRLCYGVPSESQLVEGVRRLARAVEGCLITSQDPPTAGNRRQHDRPGRQTGVGAAGSMPVE